MTGRTLVTRSAPRRGRGAQLLIGVAAWGLAAAAFAPIAWSPLIFVALVPWLVEVGRARRRGFYLGYVAGLLCFGACLLGWVGSMVNAGVAGWAGWCVVALIFVVLALPGAFVIRELTHRRGVSMMAVIPLTFTSLDIFREWAIDGISWHSLGYALSEWTALIQVAEIGRVWPLTLFVWAVNVFLAEVWLRWRDGRGPGRNALAIRAVVLLAVATGLLGFGRWRIDAIEEQLTDGPVVVGLQGNVRQEEKNEIERVGRLEMHRRYLDLIRAATAVEPDAALYIWPETSFFAIDERADRGTRSFGESLIRTLHARRRTDGVSAVEELHAASSARNRTGPAPIFLLGASTYDDLSPGDEDEFGLGYRHRNSAILVESDAGRLVEIGRYHKRRLAPFGEYLPLKGFPGRKRVKELLLEHAGFFPALTPGEDSVLFELRSSGESLRFAVNICFEIVFPRLFEEARREGADFIVNVSNDAWYDDSAERDLVHAQTRFRAVENRLAVVRVSNTGISALVDPLGRERAVVEVAGERLSVAGFFAAPVPVGGNRISGWPEPAVAAWIVVAGQAALILGALAGKRRKTGDLGADLFT